MARPNEEVEALFQEYADLISITTGDAHRARAYEKAARSIGGYDADVSRLDDKGLRAIPNVGSSIADKISEYLRTGRVSAVEEARTRVPAGVRQLTAIPMLGPKRAKTLYETLHVSSVPELVEAIHAGRLRDLRGFGARSEEKILHGVELMQAAGDRVLLPVAGELAGEIVAALSAVTGCVRCEIAGSLRRMRETVGDVDILVAARKSEPFMAAFTALPQAAEVVAEGPTKSGIRTRSGLRVDLRVVHPDAWGAALLYFTGSRAHNIKVRRIAQRQGLKLSEYGLFDAESGRRIVSRTEEKVYQRLGMPWIPPPLREDRGEIEAAQEGRLPEVLTRRQLRGDLHTHTDLTDGLATLEEMVRAAADEHGYSYYAITDHAPALAMQRMTDEKILQQREQVRRLGASLHKGPRLLHGTELNIAPDGGVDWPDGFLAGFDLCVASVHSHFQQGRAAMTRRIVRACENPHVHVLGHLTTRLIGKRPGIDIDPDEVFAACARTGTALEVNSQPDRLDVSDELILRARGHGVKFAVDSDAHSVRALDGIRYGVGTAQRGWLTAEDVINTWSRQRLLRFIEAKRRRGRPAG
ncbi:DNA polymerase/3'-5' exonuclease PolX [Streptomyces aidingensis]|uniref:DNA polymerase beta n=1 Tax=Streptomyces aidingensis TaxID=910347 RepID=A0A1I1LBH6_9ACTN|nr:DNA polymerase/3'-5' exonuclease PolX [Streptomyces aidingensis]SFC70379.1 DNA polymerase (family 10) [Streptomyces aidingensis]